jgi:cation transport ATPase
MAAKAGILAQGGGTAFQMATQVDAVVFDKTGTLTQNRPSVVGVQRFREDGWLLKAVRVIEQTSSHPLAAALVRYSQEEMATNEKGDSDAVVVISMEEVAGKGALGRIKVADQTYSFRLGNQALMGEGTCPMQNQDAVDIWKRLGYSVVYFSLSDVESTKSPSKENRPVFSMAAVFAIADPVRPEAKQVIAALERSRKRVFMLSGDNETTARTIGRELGIDGGRIVAGMLPHEKAQFIRGLKEKEVTQSGRWPWSQTRSRRPVVMFAGDGLNDSAAVASADVGCALFVSIHIETF